MQYFRPALSYRLSLVLLFCLFEWPLKTVFSVVNVNTHTVVCCGCWYVGGYGC